MGRGKSKRTLNEHNLAASVYTDLTLSAIHSLNSRDYQACAGYLAELYRFLKEAE